MLRWIGRIVYFIFILYLTAQVFSFSYFSRLQAYYDEEIRDSLDDDMVYIRGMNTLLQTNYIRLSPVVYEYVSDTGDYQFKLSIYALSASNEDERYDGMMIFVNRLAIREAGELLEDPVLKIKFTLDRASLQIGDDISNEGEIIHDPSQPFAFYNLPAVFLFDTEGYMQAPDGTFAELESIALYYSDGSVTDDTEFAFTADPFFLATTFDTAENVLGGHKTTLTIDTADYRLREVFASVFPTDDELVMYDLFTEKDSLSSYNGLVWRTMTIYVLVVSGVTYLLFFHRPLKEALALRRMQKNQDQSNTEDAIFKDE